MPHLWNQCFRRKCEVTTEPLLERFSLPALFVSSVRDSELAQRNWRSVLGLLPRESESVSHSVVSDSLGPHGLYVAHQVPLSMGLF